MIATTFLFLIGSYLFSKTASTFWSLLCFGGALLSFCGLTLLAAVSDYLSGGQGMTDAVRYHLFHGGVEGVGFQALGGMLWMILLALCATIGILFLVVHKTHRPGPKHRGVSVVAACTLAVSLLLHPALYVLLPFRISPGTAFGVSSRDAQVSSFDELYRESVLTPLSAPKNLIYIYLEGLEETFSISTSTPGLTPNLDRLSTVGTRFSDIRQLPGTEYTIAGMVASQCGIPLFSASHGNSMSGMDTYLPGARCLGDLLKDAGYTLSYMGGADLSFAGKGQFYRSHGFDRIQGKDDLTHKLLDTNYQSHWGLFDDSVLPMATQEMKTLSEADTPFAFFLLTLDTHHPNGVPSLSCDGILYADGSDQLLNTIHCSDILIGNFVDELLASELADDSIIVLASDHLSMSHSAADLFAEETRTNRFLIIDPKKPFERRIDRAGSMLDVTPTILPALGFTGHVGVGQNLLAQTYTPARSEKALNHAGEWKDSLQAFWGYPDIQQELVIDPTAQTVHIDSREFAFPVLIELEEDLSTALKFEFNLPEFMSLENELIYTSPHQHVLLIDTCENGFCLSYGLPDQLRKIPIACTLHISQEALLAFITSKGELSIPACPQIAPVDNKFGSIDTNSAI